MIADTFHAAVEYRFRHEQVEQFFTAWCVSNNVSPEFVTTRSRKLKHVRMRDRFIQDAAATGSFTDEEIASVIGRERSTVTAHRAKLEGYKQ